MYAVLEQALDDRLESVAAEGIVTSGDPFELVRELARARSEPRSQKPDEPVEPDVPPVLELRRGVLERGGDRQAHGDANDVVGCRCEGVSERVGNGLLLRVGGTSRHVDLHVADGLRERANARGPSTRARRPMVSSPLASGSLTILNTITENCSRSTAARRPVRSPVTASGMARSASRIASSTASMT